MLYEEKAEQCKLVADYCYENRMYESAANRYYYCLFIYAKGMLAQNTFDYKGFLRSSEHLDDKQRSHQEYSHSTIHIALAVYMNFNVNPFKKMWNTVYKSRILADYENEEFDHDVIDNCRNNFYSIYRRIHNG